MRQAKIDWLASSVPDKLADMSRAVAFLFLTVTVLLQYVTSALVDEDHYTTRYDAIDVDQILSNERIFKKYVDCLLDKGTCTKDAKELKRIIPDAAETECRKCNAIQKQQAGKVIQFIIQNKRPIWNELLLKYDPQGVYRKRYNYEDEDSVEEILRRFAKDNPTKR